MLWSSGMSSCILKAVFMRNVSDHLTGYISSHLRIFKAVGNRSLTVQMFRASCPLINSRLPPTFQIEWFRVIEILITRHTVSPKVVGCGLTEDNNLNKDSPDTLTWGWIFHVSSTFSQKFLLRVTIFFLLKSSYCLQKLRKFLLKFDVPKHSCGRVSHSSYNK
jgi:hypothetical protein